MKEAARLHTASFAQRRSGIWRRAGRRLIMDRYMYLLALPGLIYYFIFHYLPMLGITIAFQDYNAFLGFSGSDWVGFKHFERLFSHPDFWLVFRNTMMISLLNIVFFFPTPIALALMLNELRISLYKRVLQTLLYLPHFLSWVVICILTITLMSSTGFVTHMIQWLGFDVQPLLDKSLFWGIITIQSIWKDAGWGTIIFLAALAGINPDLYEAATMDGANRWQQMRFITVPSIMSTIVILLILRLGQILNLSFDQLYIMGNAIVRDVAEVFDTYVYKVGVVQGNFSFATAVGIFKSVIGLLLVLGTNYLSRKTSEHSLF
ncbi:sugar ABC transporter permease [Paenibacillus sp. IB182496]|uniref:Sugar ABC transporter permease n=1 Tax=Paenibacillus sabuli TaxID=2772509 RepID=A0A927BW97_9BACL|nr:ABC transporter permease subunit [Paenibacillus sabuli]MBD2846518.1 sugar ABC transporter permease [Paenibacillus sabuli]